MDCSKCKYRQWEEGDHSESPPGYGIYYCELADRGLTEEVSKGQKRPENCPVRPKLEPGNVWQHIKGRYLILHLANKNISPEKSQEYPMTVVYRREDEPDGEVYAKKPHEFILNRTHVQKLTGGNSET